MRTTKPDIGKFSFAELTSNSNGKTSGSGTAGIFIVTIGGICFLLGSINIMFLEGSIDIITQSIIFTGIGATLLGYRKSKDNGTISVVEETSETPEPPSEEMINS